MFCIIFSHWLAEMCVCLQINMCVTYSVFPFIVISSSYLANDLQCVADLDARRCLRSASTSTLVVPVTRLSTVGDRAFPVAAARVWNSLPADVTSSPSLSTFKRRLKTEPRASIWFQHWGGRTMQGPKGLARGPKGRERGGVLGEGAASPLPSS